MEGMPGVVPPDIDATGPLLKLAPIRFKKPEASQKEFEAKQDISEATNLLGDKSSIKLTKQTSDKCEYFPHDYCVVFPITTPGELKENTTQYSVEDLRKKFRSDLEFFKHSIAKSFLANVFDSCAGKKKQIDQRTFDIACAYVVICTLQNSVGLKCDTYYSYGNDELYCLISTNIEHLRRFADEQNYLLQFNAETDKSPIRGYGEFDRELDDLWQTHQVVTELGFRTSFFRQTDRLKLIEVAIDYYLVFPALLEEKVIKGWFPLHCNIGLKNKLGSETSLCSKLFATPESPDDIREYCGEEIGLYFAWLNYYKQCLLPISVPGVLVFVVIVLDMTVEAVRESEVRRYVCAVFSALLCIWGQWFINSWRREASYIITRWGMADFHHREHQRPDFKGHYVESQTLGYVKTKVVNGKKIRTWVGKRILYYSAKERRKKVLISTLISVVSIVLMLGVIVASCYARIYVEIKESPDAWQPLAMGVVTAVQIIVMNAVYTIIAKKLVDWENWETESNQKRSLTQKIFLFTFVNTFFTFFFIAFVKGFVTGCRGACYYAQFDQPYNTGQCPMVNDIVNANNGTWPAGLELSEPHHEYRGDCIYELMLQIAVVFTTNLLIGNLKEIAMPWLMTNINRKLEARSDSTNNINKAMDKVTKDNKDGDGHKIKLQKLAEEGGYGHKIKLQKLTEAEKQYSMPLYDPFLDYNEMIIQLAFVLLFAVAMPLTPLLAYLNNSLETRVDILKLTLSQRPTPHGAMDIGKWANFIDHLLNIGVFTNTLIFSLMGNNDYLTELLRGMLFFFGVMMAKALVTQLIRPLPFEVQEIRARHRALNLVLVKGIRTWDDDEVEADFPEVDFSNLTSSEQRQIQRLQTNQRLTQAIS